MNNIKLIVTDMDGTFLNTNYETSPEFPAIYKELSKRNILFVPASGRQYQSITPFFEPILDEIAIIAENGGYVTIKGEEIFVDELKEKYIKEIVLAVREIPESTSVLSAKNGAYFETNNAHFKDFLDKYYVLNQKREDLTDNINDKVVKIAIHNPLGTEKNVYPIIKEFEKYDLDVVVSGPNWLDVMNRNMNKGKALSELQKKLKITPEETMAFGDYMNDIEMLKLAKYSFAMANAHSSVKEVTNYEAPSNKEFGVITVLKKFLNQ